MRAVPGVWVVAVAGAAACAPAPDEGSIFEVTIGDDAYEVLPVARESIAEHGESLLIDLRRDDAVYLIDGRAPVTDLIRTPLVCPNGMRTNVADFLLGQAIGWGERGSMIALSAVAPERVQAIVGSVAEWCVVVCRPCPDGATLCTETGPCEGNVSDLAGVWFEERQQDRPRNDPGTPTNPPAWNGPPEGPDPTPFTPDDGGDPWSGSGSDGGGDWGSGGGDDSGGDGGGGWSGGDAGGPNDPW